MTFTAPGQKARLIFTATAGRQITALGTVVTSGVTLYWPLSVLKPDGITLAQVSGASTALLEPVVLPVGGTYTLLIDPYDVATGTGTVTLYDAADVTGPVTINGPAASFTLSAPGQRAKFTVTGAAGQRIRVDGTVQSGSWLYYPLALLKPDGTTLGSGYNGGAAAVGPVTLPVAGTYTVLVDPYGTSTGSGSITVTEVP